MHESPHNNPTTLLLCRHGESPWNVVGRIQGQSPDAPGLSARGREQARLLAERLRTAGIDVLVSSDLERALETAGYVGRALGLQPTLDSRWREIHLGKWQGLTRAEVAERWPGTLEAVQRGEDPPRGGGETYQELGARTLAAIDDLARRYRGQTVCVVCHGGNIRSALIALPGEPGVADARANHIPNTSVTVLQVDGNGARVVSPPDVSHLDGLAPVEDREGNDEAR